MTSPISPNNVDDINQYEAVSDYFTDLSSTSHQSSENLLFSSRLIELPSHEIDILTSSQSSSHKLMIGPDSKHSKRVIGPDIRCSNCSTSVTSLWRKSVSGSVVCNACGLYYKIHGQNRPRHLRKDVVRGRRRKQAGQVGKRRNNTLGKKERRE